MHNAEAPVYEYLLRYTDATDETFEVYLGQIKESAARSLGNGLAFGMAYSEVSRRPVQAWELISAPRPL